MAYDASEADFGEGLGFVGFFFVVIHGVDGGCAAHDGFNGG